MSQRKQRVEHGLRDVLTELIARDVKVYSGLDHRLVGATGRALDGGPPPPEARA